MLSRVAENLYWLGRYLERAENMARMAHVEYLTSVEGGGGPEQSGSTWDALIAASGARQAYFTAREAEPERAPADFLVLGWDNPNSIRSTLAQARNVARTVRGHVSREVWEELNQLHLYLSRRETLVESDLFDLCGEIKRRIETVFGLYDNTVLFDEGRDWFRCGLYLERADMTTRVLDTKYHLLLPEASEVGGPLDRFQWTAILKSVSAWEAFRKTDIAEISGRRVAGMLLFRPDFPRSILFCTRALLRHYRNATVDTPRAQCVHAEREIVLLEMDLAALTVEEVIAGGLHEFLDGLQTRFGAIDHATTEHIFRALPDGASAVPA